MTTRGAARRVAPFVRGFDCLAPVPSAIARRAVAAGYAFAGRYLSTLTAEEVTDLFAAGLGIAPITVASIDEPLTETTGQQRGQQAIREAEALGVPAGVHVTIDLEAPPDDSNVVAHVNAFARELVTAGFGAMLYVGVPQPLSSAVLYSLLPNRYWKGAGRVVDAMGRLAEPDCGWCLEQLEPLEQSLFGMPVDVDVTKEDYEGRTAVLWWPS